MLDHHLNIAQYSKILDAIKDDVTLNKLIYMNQVVDGVVTECTISSKFKSGKNYMCIYIDKTIIHYFTIIRAADGMNYLNSSYGSPYVCVTQYTTILDLNEFRRFIVALNNPGQDEEFIGKFYLKYFLKDNLGVNYTEDEYEIDSSLLFKRITPDEGNMREINYITHNTMRDQIRCGIITNYADLVIKRSLQTLEKCSR